MTGTSVPQSEKTSDMIRAETEYFIRSPLVCLQHCTFDESRMCEVLRSCRHYGLKRQALRVPTPWATSTDLHASGIPDPLIVTGPSIRRDLWPPSRRERALTWLVGTAVREPMALVCYAVSLLAVGYVLYHVAAAVVEGRLRL